jgi:hypothetical protein
LLKKPWTTWTSPENKRVFAWTKPRTTLDQIGTSWRLIMELTELMEHYSQMHRPKLESWQDSEAVVELSGFVKSHQGFGFKIVQSNGKPALRFEPGLESKDAGPEAARRWELAEMAEDLFWSAMPDLVQLLQEGKIDLPQV